MGKLLQGLKQRMIEGSQDRMVRRAKIQEITQKHKEIYAKAYGDASTEAIKRRAKEDAKRQFRTTGEKTQDFLKAFGSLSGQTQKKKPTQKYVIKSGKAYPIAKQKTKPTKTTSKKKTKPKDPFDIDLDIGFDF